MEEIKPLENIYSSQNQDLTVGKDIKSTYSRLPLNTTNRISTPQGFIDDVQDEFMLNWVGQIFQRNNLKDDFNFVPIITGLTETAIFKDSVFITRDPKQYNVVFIKTDK